MNESLMGGAQTAQHGRSMKKATEILDVQQIEVKL